MSFDIDGSKELITHIVIYFIAMMNLFRHGGVWHQKGGHYDTRAQTLFQLGGDVCVCVSMCICLRVYTCT